MGSLMIEENVVSAAGTVHHLTLEQIKNAIREAGYVPRQRNVFYGLLESQPPIVSYTNAVHRADTARAHALPTLTVVNSR
jgi:cyclic dehypoxanthinyl futalosine synthase